MKVTFFFRNLASGFSIRRVFEPLMDVMTRRHVAFRDLTTPHAAASVSVVGKNLWWAFRHRDRWGINVVTGDIHYAILAFWGCRSVLTVHDLVTLEIPGSAFKRWMLRKLWFSLPLAMADRVVCISEGTRRRLISEFRVPEEKVRVIHNSVPPLFRYSPKADFPASPRILQIGTQWNKNLERTIPALAGIDCTLCIVGTLTEEQRALLSRHGIRYENPCRLSAEEIYEEYVKSDIISIPSLLEGFGMPIIEGQTVGRPILTSAIAPLDEVSGGAACLVNPQSTESIRAGFLRIMEDADFRRSLIEAGRKNVAAYQPDAIYAQWQSLFDSFQSNNSLL